MAGATMFKLEFGPSIPFSECKNGLIAYRSGFLGVKFGANVYRLDGEVDHLTDEDKVTTAKLVVQSMFPSAGITKMTFSTVKPRKKPKEGDIKIVKGVKYIRKRERYQGADVYNHGRPCYEWVRADES